MGLYTILEDKHTYPGTSNLSFHQTWDAVFPPDSSCDYICSLRSDTGLLLLSPSSMALNSTAGKDRGEERRVREGMRRLDERREGNEVREGRGGEGWEGELK